MDNGRITKELKELAEGVKNVSNNDKPQLAKRSMQYKKLLVIMFCT